MNINPDYENQDVPSSSEVIEGVQHILYNMLIEPMQKELSLNDVELLSKIGDALKSVAEKATAYEQLNKTTLDKNYRN
tara:strand:+ start:6712 stop:6945 length:234 start_codon:yes stop_codon:yes gene_type:complete